MILFMSNSGECLPIAYRMKQEGEQVLVYIHSPKYRGNYYGLVDKVGVTKLPAMVKKAYMVIFDIVRPNEKTAQDIALLKVFRCSKDAPEVFGAVADKIRDKVLTVGASSETAKWELDREEGFRLAEKIGIDIPETHTFKNLKDGVKFLKNSKDRWVFKPSNNQDLDLTYVETFPGDLSSKMEGEYQRRIGDKVEYILQKFVDGVEISTELWFDGKNIVSFNHTLEEKKMMNGNLGPSIGSQSNTVWVKKKMSGLLVKELSRLIPRLKQTGYIGPVDVNCVVSEKDHKPYFLEWTCRQGYDALYCLLSLLKSGVAKYFKAGFKPNFHEGHASSQRITIPPFPYSESALLREYAQGVGVMSGIDHPGFWAEDVAMNDGRLECAGADGILGVIAMKGNSLGGSVGNTYRSIDKLQVASTLQYRTDLGKSAEKRLNTLKKWGVEVE